jgi:hypothetical protein
MPDVRSLAEQNELKQAFLPDGRRHPALGESAQIRTPGWKGQGLIPLDRRTSKRLAVDWAGYLADDQTNFLAPFISPQDYGFYWYDSR